MKHLRLIPLVLAIFLFSCGGKKDTTSISKEEDGSVQPEDIRPKIDTRFEEKFFEAQLYKSKGQTEKAYSAFQECLALKPNEHSVLYELARIERTVYLNTNSAATRIKKAVELSPQNSWYHRLQGEIYMDMGKYELAGKAFQTAYKFNADDPNILYDQASALIAAGKYSDAIAVYDMLEKKLGPYEELSYQKHDLYIELKQPEKAARELEKLAEAFPDEARYWGVVAQYYYQENKQDKAKQALDKMVKADPDNGLVHYQLSEYYAATGDEERSFQELKKAFQTTDLNIDQKIMVMVKYYELTEYNSKYLPQAYELLDILKTVNGSEAKTYSIRGDFFFRDRRDNDALEAFQKALTLDRSKSQIWDQTLSLEYSLGRYAELEKDAAAASELFPTSAQFYWFHGIALERNNKTQEAIDVWDMGKELVIENPQLLSQFYSSLGSAYNKLKNYPKSDESFDKALFNSPKDVYTLNNYAYYLSLRKAKLDKAKQMIEQAIQLEPKNTNFFDTYAWVLFQMGQYNDALQWIESAINTGKITSGEVYEHYGDILYKTGNIEKAVQQWKTAQTLGGASDKINSKIQSRSIE